MPPNPPSNSRLPRLAVWSGYGTAEDPNNSKAGLALRFQVAGYMQLVCGGGLNN